MSIKHYSDGTTSGYTYRLHWISADGQGSIDCGTLTDAMYKDEILREGHELEARETLLDQCGEPAEERAIYAGYFKWQAEEGK